MIMQQLRPRDEAELAILFNNILNDITASHFRPHVFNAKEITNYSGLDLYLGIWVDKRLQGYAMLRGWDEGYSVPSLGIYLSPIVRGTGLSIQSMKAIHDLALAKGA